MKDINVLIVDANTGKISFDFNKGTEKVLGRKALLQLITLNLLNDKGSNVYNTNKGSTVSSLISGSYDKDSADIVKTLITIAVDEVEQQIIQEQRSITFAEDELDGKLGSMEVFSVNYNPSGPAWDVKIFVKTAANNIGIIGL